jgi:hypothetical protein
MTLSLRQKLFDIVAMRLSALVEDISEIRNGIEFRFCIGIRSGSPEDAREDA